MSSVDVVLLGGVVNYLDVQNNMMFGNNHDLNLIKHSWNINSANFTNNILEEQNAYVYYQSGGTPKGKFKQEINLGKLRFNGTPNSNLSQFVNCYFNNGEILHNFNGNNDDFICNQSGYYVTNTWVNGTSYNKDTKLKNSSNNVYMCITKGSDVSTVEPTQTTGSVTESDGYEWKYCGTVCTFKN